MEREMQVETYDTVSGVFIPVAFCCSAPGPESAYIREEEI